MIVDYLEGRDKSITLYMNGDGSSMKETFHPEHSNEGENVAPILCAAHLRRPLWNLRHVEPEAEKISDCFDELFIMKPIAIYRNNTLFCGSHKGAERLANVMSLIHLYNRAVCRR